MFSTHTLQEIRSEKESVFNTVRLFLARMKRRVEYISSDLLIQLKIRGKEFEGFV
jgi:hypothetical protein